jgi:hypothetical protein
VRSLIEWLKRLDEPVVQTIKYPELEKTEHWGNIVAAQRVMVGEAYAYKCPFCEDRIPQGGLKRHLIGRHPNQGRYTWELIQD